MSGLEERIIGKMPSLDEPIVFIDFDDVINVFGEYREAPGIVKDVVCIKRGTVRPRGEPISEDKQMEIAWRPEVVGHLREMNCVWLTSWKGLTQELLNPVLGLDFGYVDWFYRGLSDSGFYGKLSAVEDIAAAAGTPVAVLDDSFVFWGGGLHEFVKSVPALAIAPRSDEGLTLEQLSELDAFIEENSWLGNSS